MTREQINTDLLINLLVSNQINNLLLLSAAKLDRKASAAMKTVIDDLSDKANSLSEKSKLLDEEENT